MGKVKLRGLRSQYHVLNALGEGTYGVVMRASDAVSGNTYAVKCRKPSKFSNNPGKVAAEDAEFRREIHFLRLLKHVRPPWLAFRIIVELMTDI